MNLGANSGNKSASTDKFDSIGLFEGEARVLENLGKGNRYTIRDASDESCTLPL